jgi:hypothetical protein
MYAGRENAPSFNFGFANESHRVPLPPEKIGQNTEEEDDDERTMMM